MFKTVAFGGFDKRDVAGYIEKIAKEYTDHTERMERDQEDLRKENQTLRGQVRDLTAKTEEQAAKLKELQESLEQAASRADRLTEQQAQVETLTARLVELEPQSESYRQFRDRIGDIECDAQSRAAELERSTYEKLRGLTAQVAEQYRLLAATFSTASAGAREELQKMEEGLSQLPQTLERMGEELRSLDETLQDQ